MLIHESKNDSNYEWCAFKSCRRLTEVSIRFDLGLTRTDRLRLYYLYPNWMELTVFGLVNHSHQIVFT